MSVTIDNVNPINLTAQMLATGAIRLFYGTTEIDSLLDDVFPQTTAISYATINIENLAGVTIDVQWNSESPITVSPRGMTSRTLSMPDPAQCNSVNVTLWSAGTMHHDPVIRLKRKLGDIVPTCSS